MSEIEPINSRLLDWLQSKKDVRFTVIKHTHADRTWYIDRMASEMNEAEIHERFMKVGNCTLEQMSMVEDFLGGAGEYAKDRFMDMAREGKLELIGQYSQPELFLSPEPTLIRTSRRGSRIAREFGGTPPRHVGHIPDSFGFPETTPEMMNELGMETLQLKRGIENIDTLGAAFYWEGPSGVKKLVVPFQGGYDNAQHLTVHGADRESGDSDEDYYKKRVGAATLRIVDHINRFGERFRQVDLPHLLLMDGSDFTRPDIGVEEVLEGVEERFRRDYNLNNLSIRTGTLGEYSELVQSSVNPISLQTYKGELRSGKEHFVLRGIESARMYLKQQMHEAGRRINDAGVASALLLLARKYPNQRYGDHPLIENDHKTHQLVYAHDESIRELESATQHDAVSGCGCNESYVEHEYAMQSSKLRAHQTMRNAFGALAERHDTYGSYKHIETTRGAVNLLPFARTSLVEVPLQDTLEHATGLRAYAQTADGEVEIPVQIVQKQDIRYATYVLNVEGLSSTDVRFEHFPKLVEPQHEKDFDGEFENEFYNVQVSSDGTLNIEDKLRGTSLKGLIFEDQGDRGDEYNFCYTWDDVPQTSEGGEASVRVINDGPVFTELQIDTQMLVPEGLDGPEGTVREVEYRSKNIVAMPISTRVRLIKGIDRIEFATTVDNTARDHRVRVRFDTPSAGETVRAREPYTLTKRTAVPIKGGEGWTEPNPIATSHHQGLLVAGDLAAYTRGLPEYEALTGKDGTIEQVALTLFRGVGYLSRHNLTTRPGGAGPGLATAGAQMLGPNTYEYAISMRGAQSDSDNIRRADDYTHPIEDGFQQMKMNDILRINPDTTAVVSEMYPAVEGDAAIVRLYNPNDSPTQVKLDGIFSQAVRVNGHDEAIGDNDTRKFEVPARGIIGVRLS